MIELAIVVDRTTIRSLVRFEKPPTPDGRRPRGIHVIMGGQSKAIHDGHVKIYYASLSYEPGETQMKIQFDCECGAEVSDFTRGSQAEFDTRLQCQECGSVYALSITKLK